MMKKIVLYILIITILFVPISFAHKGRTDSNGGHYDSSTGEYHYHHGYSAHQHVNGICPYDDTVKTTGSHSFTEGNDELLSDLQSKNADLEDEISELEEKIYNYKLDLEETGFNSIKDLNNKIDELESDISNMWFWFFVIITVSMVIFYNIGFKASKNMNNKK